MAERERELVCPACGQDWSKGLPSFSVICWCATCTQEKEHRIDYANALALKRLEARDRRFHEERKAKAAALGISVQEYIRIQAEKDQELWG